ncbi:MAG: amidohydrolase [Candidatus Aenigmatarchaeota archaeon]
MILIKNARFIITPEEILENKNILIENNKISFGIDKSDVVIDAKDKVVLPGLTNSHTHLAMTLFRGYGDDMPLMSWLKEKIWPLESKLREEDCYIGSLLGCLEMIKSGTTSFYDMYFHMGSTAKACERSGIRGNLAWAVLDKEITTQSGDPIRNAEHFIKKWKDHELINPMIGPHSIYTCSKETLLKAKELSEKYNSLLHIHLSETEKEVKDSKEKFGKRPVEYLDSIGFLKNVLAAHCVWLNENEIKILANNNIKIAHCPISNLKLSSGIAPIEDMIKNGLKIGLGTDGAASNNNLDLFEEMKNSALIQKYKYNSTALPAQKALEMACFENKIEIGKKADLILIDIKKPHFYPLHNIISHLVYSANGSDVTDVICNGKLIMKNRRVLTLDEEEILEKVQKISEDLIHR